MSKTSRTYGEYPTVGQTYALWYSPTQWFADVRILARGTGGRVTVQFVRSVLPTHSNMWRRTYLAKLLRSGYWKMYGWHRVRSHGCGITRVDPAANIVRKSIDPERDTLNALPDLYHGNDARGRAVISRHTLSERERRELAS